MSDHQHGSGSRSDGSHGGGGGRPMVGFLFGDVDSKMQLQDEYLDEDARESLAALGSERLGGDKGGLSLEAAEAGIPVREPEGNMLTDEDDSALSDIFCKGAHAGDWERDIAWGSDAEQSPAAKRTAEMDVDDVAVSIGGAAAAGDGLLDCRMQEAAGSAEPWRLPDTMSLEPFCGKQGVEAVPGTHAQML